MDPIPYLEETKSTWVTTLPHSELNRKEALRHFTGCWLNYKNSVFCGKNLPLNTVYLSLQALSGDLQMFSSWDSVCLSLSPTHTQNAPPPSHDLHHVTAKKKKYIYIYIYIVPTNNPNTAADCGLKKLFFWSEKGKETTVCLKCQSHLQITMTIKKAKEILTLVLS